MNFTRFRDQAGVWRLLFILVFVALIYWQGLFGGWLFDDYPNIVDNPGVQPNNAGLSAFINAAFSSPSSEFKRPLSSLTFAANFLASGLDPFWMKLTNVFIHLANGVLVFGLIRMVLQRAGTTSPSSDNHRHSHGYITSLSLLITAAWLLLPINLTAVLYVVQRMESLANFFVLVGLIGYMHGRQRMLVETGSRKLSAGFLLCLASMTLPTAIGVMAKETAVMLPLYAFLMEWCAFDFRTSQSTPSPYDRRIALLFTLFLAIPLVFGLGYLLPSLLQPKAWAARDFTLATRLLTEPRVVANYIRWTLLPMPWDLSFYHDEFEASSGALTPWTTLVSISLLSLLTIAVFKLRRRRPLIALGISLFLGSHLLTGTILPLELIYEHRNYFSSLGLLMAVIPLILPSPAGALDILTLESSHTRALGRRQPILLHRYISLLPIGLLIFWWTAQTAMTSYAWGDPLRLAKELADRGPESPRAQYELGRTYIIYSRYNPMSPYVPLAHAALERAASLPKSSVLPQQALIFMNSRMHLPIRDAWWDSMIAKLSERPPGVQDESSLIALMHCMQEKQCDLPKERLEAAFSAAVSHEAPSGRLMAAYGEYAWNLLDNRIQGEHWMAKAVSSEPNEPAYRITWIRMLVALNRRSDAAHQFDLLKRLNIGGRLQQETTSLQDLLNSH